MHPPSILRVAGIICIIITGWMLAPLAFSVGRGETVSQQAFIVSFTVSLFIGVTTLLATNRVRISLGKRDFAILIPLIVTIATILSALPLYLGGASKPFFMLALRRSLGARQPVWVCFQNQNFSAKLNFYGELCYSGWAGMVLWFWLSGRYHIWALGEHSRPREMTLKNKLCFHNYLLRRH